MNNHSYSDWDFLRLLEMSAHQVYRATLHACDTTFTKKLQDELHNPKVGDLVLETTTLNAKDRDGCRLGRLKRIAREEFQLSDEARAEYERGSEPIPTETVYYLDLPDGREFRWHNASFIKVLERFWD